MRDSLNGFEKQSNKLCMQHGQGRDITEEKDLPDEASRDYMRTPDFGVQHQLLTQHQAKWCFPEAGGEPEFISRLLWPPSPGKKYLAITTESFCLQNSNIGYTCPLSNFSLTNSGKDELKLLKEEKNVNVRRDKQYQQVKKGWLFLCYSSVALLPPLPPTLWVQN